MADSQGAVEQTVYIGHVVGTAARIFDKAGTGSLGGYRACLLANADKKGRRAPKSYATVLDAATMRRACALSADRGVESTEIGYGPELLAVITKAADEGDVGAKEVQRQYTESGGQTASMTTWCVQRLLRLGAAVEQEVRAFHDMMLKKYEAWHVDEETGKVDYSRPGKCCGAASACSAYLHDVLCASLSPDHARLIKSGTKPGCHYGLIYYLGGALAGFNPAAGQFNWDEVDRMEQRITTHRHDEFLPGVDRILRAVGAGEGEIFLKVVSMVEEHGQPRDTIVMRIGELSPAVAGLHSHAAHRITSTFQALANTSEYAAVTAFYHCVFREGGGLSELLKFRDDASVRIPRTAATAWPNVADKVRARCQFVSCALWTFFF